MPALIAPFSTRSWLYRTVLLFALAAAVVTLGAWPVARAYDAARIDVVEARERGYLAAIGIDLQNAVLEVIGDLRVTANMPAMNRFLNGGDPEEESAVAHGFQNIMQAYGRYDQIRLLDTSGREVVRVDNVEGQPVVVPRERLEDRSDRYYVTEVAGLGRGDVYVSPLDLKVENGQVVVPYRPILRTAALVFDSSGNRRGIVVLNVRGESLLERFRAITRAEPLHRAMLLDPRGYWLSNSGQDEWGFMLGRHDATFANAYPGEWPAIAATDRGTIRSPSGLIVFSTLRLSGWPMDVADTGTTAPAGAVHHAQYWKIVLLVPRAQLLSRSLLHQPIGQLLSGAVYLLLLLLSGLVAYISLHLWRAREAERAAARDVEDLYERAPCGYHSLDRNGLIVRMNQTELNWLGYRRDEVVGRMHITDLMTDGARKLFAQAFPRLIESGFVSNVEFDYVRKDGTLLPVLLNASAVRDATGNFLMSRSTVFDASERRRLEHELLRQARTDALTGVGNRRHFFELAEHELARSVRMHGPLSLLLLDIDEFKKVNDTWGHDAGDAVLKAFCAACAGILREMDVFARLGGEEFVVLMPDTDAAQARVLAERVREHLATLAITRGDRTLRVTVSIGVATLNTGDPADSIDAMIKRADAALYQAKNAGRNRVRVAG